MKKFSLALLVLPTVALAKLPSQDDSPNPPREPGKLSKVYAQEAVIDAPAAVIWDIMMDLPAYQEWNPWIVSAQGSMEKGGIVFVEAKLGTKTLQAKHVVLLNEPYQRFCWRDAGWNADFIYGQRCRTLTPLADGSVHYKVELLLDGILSSISDLIQGKDLTKGLADETAALKVRAEELQ